MDEFYSLIAKFIAPLFYPLFGNQRIYFGYLASALLLAGFVYWTTRARQSGWSVKGFLAYCFPKSVYGHRSAIVDYWYFVINKASFALFLAPLVVSAAVISDLTLDTARALWGIESLGFAAGLMPGILLTLASILAFDAGIFCAHYLQHKVPLLWEFHKVHHSAEVMTPITVYRMHPVDDLLSGAFVGVLTGVMHGAFGFLYAEGAESITVFELNLFLFLFYVFGYNLRHSHIWLAYPRWVSHIFVSPAQHQVHHSKDPRHFDKNIGFMFAFWDYFAGTLYVPEAKEQIEYGLYGDEHKAFDSVWNLYVLPFKNVAARFRTARGDGT